MLKIEVKLFDPAQASAAVDLAARAFTVVAADARPKDTAAFLAHMHGTANPSGRAWIAVAREDGRDVASVAGLPARFRTVADTTVIGYQIGTFVVDASKQRQGFGSQVLEELTHFLVELSDSFVYAYPNPRSQVALDRGNYLRVAEIPTLIHLPTWKSYSAKDATTLRDAQEREWSLSFARGDQAAEIVRKMPDLREPPPGFVRDQAYFLWRFFGPDCEQRYEFAVCTTRNGEHQFVLALARHQFNGRRFTILVDVYPNVFAEHRALATRVAQIAGRRWGAWFVYLNTNAKATAGTPWRVRLPASRNPRPVQLMIYPENSWITPDELRASLAMTADWNGF